MADLARFAGSLGDRGLRPLLLVVVTFLVYAGTLSYGFLPGWDDDILVLANEPHLQLSLRNVAYVFTHPYLACYIPVTMLSYMVDYALVGLQPWGYHLHNLIWHILTVLIIYAVLKELGIRPGIAFFASLMFSVHPQRTACVAWVAERKGVLSAFLFWSSVLLYMKSRDRAPVYVASLLISALALLSKPVAVSLPVVLVCYDISKQRAALTWRYSRRVLPFFAMSLGISVLTFFLQHCSQRQQLLPRNLAVGLGNMVWYARQTFVPYDLSPIYPRTALTPGLVVSVLVSILLIVLISSALCRINCRYFLNVFVPILVSYFAVMAPTVGFVRQYGSTNLADRHCYLSSVFVILPIAILAEAMARALAGDRLEGVSIPHWLAQFMRGRTLVASGLACVYLAFLITTNVCYSGGWSDPYTLHRTACLRRPANTVSLWFLGKMELLCGRWDVVRGIADRIEIDGAGRLTADEQASNEFKAIYLRGAALYGGGAVRGAASKLEQARAHLGQLPPGVYAQSHDVCVLRLLIVCYQELGMAKEEQDCRRELERLLAAYGESVDMLGPQAAARLATPPGPGGGLPGADHRDAR